MPYLGTSKRFLFFSVAKLSLWNRLGLAYAGSAREDLLDLLMPIISDVGLEMQLIGAASLALGFIFVGTCHGDLTSLFLQTLMERDETALKSTHTRFIGLALGLLFLGMTIGYL